MFPDDLLTKAHSKHDVGLNPHIIAPDPYQTTDVYIDVFGPDYKDLVTPTEQPNTMSTGDDESSGINGRLRPRKSYVCSPQTIKATRKLDSKSSQEKSKHVTTPSKAILIKPDDLSKKSDCSSAVEYLCPYCDKFFVSKQTASKHTRRIHFSASKQDTFISCLYCNHTEPEPNDIFKHMIDSHPNQYFACLDCHTRYSSTTELAEHKLNICERQKLPYRSKLRQTSSGTNKKSLKIDRQIIIRDEVRQGYNSIVISCELKPTHISDGADIEDNITTNLILPSNKNLGNKVIDKNAVILLDDLQWNKRIPQNFSFHNTDADQILSRLGVVHRSPRTGESTRKDWFKTIDDTSQKFERCFDTSFYSKVASNVQENLSKFLDGSFNFNPDPNHTIKYRKAKNSVPINTVEGFPILLSCEQYSRNLFDGYMPRAIAPKHKWKWDNLENDRNPFSADQIKRDSHINNCIVTLVSSLDIWTQLRMRKKFEEKFKTTPLEKKTEKKKLIGNELKEILESRQLPPPNTHITRKCCVPTAVREGLNFPSSLGLTPTSAKYEIKPAVLSGEWVRPRCYVCCACGAQTRDPRALSSHISTQHPNAQVQHYEIPGELLLNADILKHLYVPPSPVYNRTRLPRGFRECTKCNKSITLEDLHQHMLDCAGDTPAVRRKCRYRQFGMRKRRSRIQDSRIRKKMGKDIHSQSGITRPKMRSEVGDAETIRKMLADLPAKRHRVMITPLSSNLRPKRKIVKQRNLLTLKKRLIEESKSRKTNEGIIIKGIDKPEICDLNKINNAHDENKTSVKRIQNKLTRRTNIFNKKTVMKTLRKSVERRQMIENKNIDDQPPVVDFSNPSSCSGNIQPDELSIENGSNRININSGPCSTREQANGSSNDGSNSRDNQHPDPNDNNGNSRDQGLPPQNVPLKHSIARLTADSDTQDKAVQFHHLFLVQQECNNVTQHVPSGQTVLFENKEVAAKLDKPPLDSYQKDEDAQNCQKTKLTKHRKGLNDCIAMLKNKLGEPISKAPDVSIQCKMDEPNETPVNYAPKAVKNLNRTDITVQCPDDSKPTDTIISPRYRQPTNVSKTIEDPIAILPTIGEYIKQNPELLIKHKVTLNNTINIQDIENKPTLIGNKDVCISTTKKLQALDDLSKSNIACKSPKPNYNRQTKHTLSEIIKQRQKISDSVDINKSNKDLQSVTMPIRSIEGSMPQTKAIIPNTSTLIGAHASVITNIKDTEVKLKNIKAQNNKSRDRSLRLNEESNRNVIDFDYQEENKPKTKFNSADTIPPAHCNTGVESILTSPLDLSGKLYANEVIAHCSKQDNSYQLRACEHYETLDLSNKGLSKQNHDIPMLPYNEEIVDLRVKHIISTQSADSSIYSEESSSNISTTTDFSLRNTEINCIPTDLSMKGKNSESCYLNKMRKEVNIHSDLRPTSDLISTEKDPNTLCLNLSAKDLPCLDLSRKISNIVTPTNKPLLENNKCSSSNIDNDKNILTDLVGLSCRNNQEKHINVHAKSNNVTSQIVEGNTKVDANKSVTKSAHITMSSKTMNNNEVLGFETHENQSRKVRYGASDFLAKPPSSDITISIRNKQNSNLTATDLTNSRNSSELVIKHNTEKVTYSFDKTLNVDNLSSALSKSGLSGIKCDISSNIPIVCHVSNPLSIDGMGSKSSIKLSNTAIPNTSTTYTTSGPVSTAANYGHKLELASMSAPKHSMEKQDIQFHASKSRHMQNKQQGNNVDNSDKIISSGVDQDPETAKKIAMLPKELVEILGNMPVNHRNQLLNVLPQYVSTSISPPPNKQNAVKYSPLSTSDDSKNNSVPSSQHTLLRKESDITHAAQYLYSGIPRSQEALVEQYQIQHSTNNYQKSETFINKSHVDAIQAAVTVEGNVSLSSLDDMKTKRHSNDITEDTIIDLTDDNVDIKHAISPPEKENKNIAIGVQSLGQKPNNEKTASLRAVRIKAPSERQKLIITDTQLNKSYQENNNIIKLNISDNNTDVSPLAVQQFEISTTDEAKIVNLQSSISVITPDSSFININNQKSSPECISSIHETRRENILPSEIENVNIVLNNVTPITMETHLMSPKTDFLNEQNKLSSDVDPSLLETHPISIKNSQEDDQIQKKIEEDDSEDDVSLAIIVKQKQIEQTKALSSQDSETSINDLDTPKLLETETDTHASDLFAPNSTSDLMSDANDDTILNDAIGNCTNKVKEGKKYKQSKKIKKARVDIATKANADNVFSAIKEPGSDINKETIFNSDKKNDIQIIKDANKILECNQEKYSSVGNEENSKNLQTKHAEENIKEKGLIKTVDISEEVKDSSSDLVKLNLKTVERNSNNIESDGKVEKCYSNDSSINSINLVCVDTHTKEHKNVNIIGNQTKLNQLSHSNSCTQLELLETLHKEEPVLTMYKCDDTNEKNNALLNSDSHFITPLRRSRRGKSLFVESSDIPYNNKNSPDIGIDQRGPLTKKQLIFSKLLQDEENTVTKKNNCYPERHEDQIQNEHHQSISHNSYANTSDETEAVAKKINKRKQSPQTKKKTKKKKSIDKSHLLIEDLNNVIKEAEINTFEKEAKIKHDDVKLVSKKILTNEENILEKGESVHKSVDTACAFEKKLKKIGKRKSNISNKELSSSSKPKKFKFCIDNEVKEVNLGEKRKEESLESIPQGSDRRSGYKPAARRGRSKSVFVKSSASEMYDPYDIDLEDMVTTTESFLKRDSLNRTSIRKKVNKMSTENCNDLMSIGTNTPTTSVINKNDLSKEQETFTDVLPMVESKAFLSDSDDSSKSDEPLKKYVEEKEKKKLELKHQDKNIEKPCKVSRKKNKKVHSVNSEKLNNVLNRDENEERIRSEQFMESFGFFSERKPRKSNLLATKKISETFHIIANENDDSFYKSKDKSNKKSLQSENKKSADDEGNLKESFNTSNKKVSKRGRKKKMSSKIEPSFCGVCRKEFRRPDNFLRHQMTLAHATRVSEVELKVKNMPMVEESNYLVVYKKQLDRLRALQDKVTRRKKYCKSLEKITIPTLEEIIADVSRTVRQQQLARRGLSRDEALFLDCCELLNASHNDDGTGRVKGSPGCKINCYSCAQTSAECLNLLEKRIDEHLKGKCDDGDVDSITAQDILESEEVRNLENDLISGLKEAACANSFSSSSLSHATYVPDIEIAAKEDFNNVCRSKDTEIGHHSEQTKKKKVFEVKEKMYPDVIEDIDMFEDKFDKIKRKCRSQAAKQTQYVETSISPKSRKKVDKKKKKKSLKKKSPNAVPTKGALKGFEGVKVSILTSEINMSSILPPSSTPMKKKKRSNSKRKKERKHSDAVKYDSDSKNKELQKKVDVYEFMDNEDAELFEFRPSTLMERFKSISNNNKDMPSTSKSQTISVDPEISSESVSDGDDFVYMSDDYICSDAETENSLISCEMGNIKGITELRKPLTPPKRKDTTEKSAVMGKIFKHNAVRTEKKVLKVKEQTKPKANLDQLFDSLLEDEPSSSMLSKNSLSPKNEDGHCKSHSPEMNDTSSSRNVNKLNKNDDQQILLESDTETSRKIERSPSPIPHTSLILQAKKQKSHKLPRKERSSLGEDDEYSNRTNSKSTKAHDDKFSLENRQMNIKHSSHRKKETVNAKCDDRSLNRRITFSPLSNYDDDSLLRVDESLPIGEDCLNYNKRKSKEKDLKKRTSTNSSDKNLSKSFEYNDSILDDSYDTGVARQRARRKCTVGKQNVLAETWSSESEPDGMPRRPNSADSVVTGLSRKKKSRKKEGQAPGGRKNSSRQILAKRNEIEASMRSCRNSTETISKVVPTTRPSAVGPKIRPRHPPYYWSDEEEEQEHVQQHGWIVGDSHKKLVTMLAHAKGKRNNDDKRHLVE